MADADSERARSQLLGQAFEELSTVLAVCQDAALIREFLSSLLTPREVLDVAARWELVNRIEQGESQRQIAHELGISLCKITRGSRELKKAGSPFRSMLHLRSTP